MHIFPVCLTVFLHHLFPSPPFQAMQMSRDGQYLLTGGDGGVVSVWQIHDLKQLFTYPGCDAGIRSMALSNDQRYPHLLAVAAVEVIVLTVVVVVLTVEVLVVVLTVALVVVLTVEVVVVVLTVEVVVVVLTVALVVVLTVEIVVLTVEVVIVVVVVVLFDSQDKRHWL